MINKWYNFINKKWNNKKWLILILKTNKYVIYRKSKQKENINR